MTVRLDRFATAIDSPVVEAFRTLAKDADERLAPAVVRAAGVAAAATAAEEAVKEEIDALDARIPEDGEAAAGNDRPAAAVAAVAPLQATRAALAAGLPGLARARAEAQAGLTAGETLQRDINALLVAGVTPSGDGLTPLVGAARAETLTESGAEVTSLVLYVRLLVGGFDRTLETKVGDDRWMTLAGVSAEYVCLSADGDIVTTGVRTALNATYGEVGDPTSIRRGVVGDRPWTRDELAARADAAGGP
jgi:hypothetical protein